MAGAGHDDRACIKAGLLERREESLRLGDRVADIVFAAVDQQEAGAVLIDRSVADGRGVEECFSADHRRAAEKLLGYLIARSRDLIVLPLGLHVVDAVKSDDGVYLAGGRGLSVAVITREQRFFTRQG